MLAEQQLHTLTSPPSPSHTPAGLRTATKGLLRSRRRSTPPAAEPAAPVAAPPSALGSTPLGSAIVEPTKLEEALTGGCLATAEDG